MTPLYGWAPRGEPLEESVPRNRGTVTTMLGALTTAGLKTVMLTEGATTGPVFLAFVRHFLLPLLAPGKFVLLDNLAAHRNKEALALIRACGATPVFLPPYSPDFNPIELAWSKLKNFLRVARARTHEELDAAVARAMDDITSADARGWFRHCGVGSQVD